MLSTSSSFGPIAVAPGCCGFLQLCRPGYVAINSISCQPDYVERFRELFCSRAHAIDRLVGFLGMYVLEPADPSDAYLVVSHWVDEAAFQAWTTSDEFLEGHRRAFADLRTAKERGEDPPMKSVFKTYFLLTN